MPGEAGLLASGAAVTSDIAPRIAAEAGRPLRGARRHPTTIGSYRILDVLGEGGMGIVYKAEQSSPRRVVALKVVRPGLLTDRMLRRFDLESQTLARLQHPSIAQIYEAGTADTGHGPQPFFAMEYVEGRALDGYCRSRDLSIRQRLALMVTICDAVAHAHTRGVIHRDLKPANIVIAVQAAGRDGGDALAALPKILDFGIARVTDEDGTDRRTHTEAGQLVGTLPYMAPEQVTGDPAAVDTRADVYALGVVLYEILGGKLPLALDNKTLYDAAQIITTIEPAPLGQLNPELRGDLETIAAKALEKDKEQRYQSPAELAADIGRFLAHEPITARPATRVYRARKFVRRNRALVAGATAAGVFLVAGAAATTWQAVAATRAERFAVRQNQIAEGVNQFLVSMLSSANPELEGQSELTVREAVDRAARQLDESLASGSPPPAEVELRVRETIVRTYRALGRPDLAEPHAVRNVELADREYGLSHYVPYSARNILSLVRQDQGRHAEAEQLAREAVEGLEKYNDNRADADLPKAVGQLGQILMVEGKHEEAETLLKRAIDELAAHPKAQPRDRIVAMENLGALYERLGRLGEAEDVLRRSTDARQREFGPDSVMAAFSLSNLGNVLQKQGKLEEALEVSSKALAIRRARLEADHPSVLTSMNNTAVVLLSLKRYDEALPLMQEVVEIHVRRLGVTHRNTLAAMNNLGYLYQDLKRLPDAEAVFRRAIEARRSAGILNDPDAVMVLNNLGMLLVEMQRYEEADGVYVEALAVAGKALPAEHFIPAIVRNNYGECLTKLSKFETAEKALLQSYPLLETTFKPGHARVDKARKRLASLYEAWQKPEKAAEWSGVPSPVAPR